jgi:hypothetical protein
VWWYISVIPAYWRLRQEDSKFKPSLDSIEGSKQAYETETLSQKKKKDFR